MGNCLGKRAAVTDHQVQPKRKSKPAKQQSENDSTTFQDPSSRPSIPMFPSKAEFRWDDDDDPEAGDDNLMLDR